MTEIIPYIIYRDVPAALEWLEKAFGFTEEMRHPTAKGMHAQMLLDGQRIMMGQAGGESPMAPPQAGQTLSVGMFVYVADVAAHCRRAEAAGAQIDQPLADHGYGMTYTVRDLDGHFWFFTQAA